MREKNDILDLQAIKKNYFPCTLSLEATKDVLQQKKKKKKKGVKQERGRPEIQKAEL